MSPLSISQAQDDPDELFEISLNQKPFFVKSNLYQALGRLHQMSQTLTIDKL